MFRFYVVSYFNTFYDGRDPVWVVRGQGGNVWHSDSGYAFVFEREDAARRFFVERAALEAPEGRMQLAFVRALTRSRAATFAMQQRGELLAESKFTQEEKEEFKRRRAAEELPLLDADIEQYRAVISEAVAAYPGLKRLIVLPNFPGNRHAECIGLGRITTGLFRCGTVSSERMRALVSKLRTGYSNPWTTQLYEEYPDVKDLK